VSLPLALYVHMPWCVRKCPYCDFNSHQLKSATPDGSYIDALLDDFAREVPLLGGRAIDTVFFGGGTPSLFAPQDIARLLEGLRRQANIARDAEITLEANPGTIEHGRFEGYAAAGINRVSLGAQTFNAEALQKLGRIHGSADTYRAVDELRTAGLDNFNLDLMFALPGQSAAQALDDVRQAIALAPAHVSYYQLTLEPGTVFYSRPPVLPDEDSAWVMQEAGQALLAGAGYAQYEVSAYARAGAQSRHNLNYWLFGDYVGIGAGAHGKLTAQASRIITRTVKPKQPRDYFDGLRRAAFPQSPGERQVVATAELPFEFMLNALRLNAGFETALFEARTGLPFEVVEAPLQRAQSRGLMEPFEAGWRATALGRRFLNDLQADFLA
jgi:putative oxygen-independent coproporphyrinogen III oxidase